MEEEPLNSNEPEGRCGQPKVLSPNSSATDGKCSLGFIREEEPVLPRAFFVC